MLVELSVLQAQVKLLLQPEVEEKCLKSVKTPKNSMTIENIGSSLHSGSPTLSLCPLRATPAETRVLTRESRKRQVSMQLVDVVRSR